MERFNVCHDKCGGGGGVGLLPCVQLRYVFVITGPVCPSLMGRYDYKEGHGMNKFHTSKPKPKTHLPVACMCVCASVSVLQRSTTK